MIKRVTLLNRRIDAGSGLLSLPVLHAVSPYGRLALRALCQQTEGELKPNEPTVCSLLCTAVWRFVLKQEARPDSPPLSLNRLMPAQVRAGTLQWKMKLEETAGLLC